MTALGPRDAQALSRISRSHSLGLDLMRKYQATIDLAKNGMVLGGELIPFIPDEREKRRDERRR